MLKLCDLKARLEAEKEDPEAIPNPDSLVERAVIHLGELLAADAAGSESEKLNAAIALFAVCLYGLLLPNVTEPVLEQAQENYEDGWSTHNFGLSSALPGLLNAICNYHFFFALAQTAYLFQKLRIGRSEFESEFLCRTQNVKA